MFKKERGKCLIINVHRVKGGEDREGANLDGSRLQHLFEQLQFDVTLMDKAALLTGQVKHPAKHAMS